MHNVIESQNLIDAIRRKRVILFVGAGVSMGLGLPSWGELVGRMAEELGIKYEEVESDDRSFYLILAEYYKLKRGTLGSLRSWMDVKWHGPEYDIGDSALHRLIVELEFPIIYTTNYDRWVERALEHYGRSYVKISNVADLVAVRENAVQVIKFHGDFDDDASLVLTESSYFERLSFESPLDLKLRADVLGKSILFIGYGLADINMRYLFYKLQKLWDASPYAKARPKSYIMVRKDSIGALQEEVLLSRGIIPIVFDSYSEIVPFLAKALPIPPAAPATAASTAPPASAGQVAGARKKRRARAAKKSPSRKAKGSA